MFSSLGTCLPCPAGRVSPRGSVGLLACRATREHAGFKHIAICAEYDA
jgi:hypothetical protein